MVYRIRYRPNDAAVDAETAVEANTPTEAMVKFRCAYGQDAEGADALKVQSVWAEDEPDQAMQ